MPLSTPPAAALLQLVSGYRAAQAVYVAAKLGIADLLRDGAKGSDALAAATRTHAPTLRRLLRTLASLGVFEEDDRGDFRLAPMGTCLRRDVPESLRAAVLVLMSQEGQRAWAALQHSVATGEPAFDHVFGMPVFDFYAAHPEAERAHAHDEGMAALTALVVDAVLGAYDFSAFQTLVDVGGGNGAFLAAILRANPALRGMLFDLPHVVAGASGVLADAGVASRCTIAAGSFFESVPEGGDAYILKRIIHDWDDERAVAILTACRRAMKRGGRLLIVDEVLPRRAAASDATSAFLLDLEMLVGTSGGRERTEEEFRTLLTDTGFAFARVVPVVRCLGVVEGLASYGAPRHAPRGREGRARPAVQDALRTPCRRRRTSNDTSPPARPSGTW